ncbi:UPF0139 membrane protein [Cavenderia fasciculata]|uniref:UPF0139 membrane protein n=1 Tax=Cavenderia fasciculata TaxID=261658 RepID=F4PV12_CACFS|nr:UPF0139 membrane protein [Cavenderia fasciculata]EGG21128.1 UPF0139 membrane protein [Cavenderia fasciculata]|eukprot:XP_004358978.1 UPF0139 membrane protein [Cavenderia fasciculata]
MNKDPRRQATAGFEMHPQLSQQEREAQNLDVWSLLCFLSAFMGIFLKYRVLVWVSLVCCCASLANMKTADSGLRAMTSSVTLSVMGLFMAYLGSHQIPLLLVPVIGGKSDSC